MEDKELLKEYVLEDAGKIWVGNYKDNRGREWVFGQFKKTILPAIMYLLELSKIDPENRGNPTILSRMISKMVRE
jgi:transglutaminase 1